MLHSIHSNLSLLVIGVSVMYYARLSNIFMIAMTLAAAVMLCIAGVMGSALLPISIGLFVVSWIFQFIGHKIEGKKPSFQECLQDLLIGPLFVLSKLFLKLGIKWELPLWEAVNIAARGSQSIAIFNIAYYAYNTKDRLVFRSQYDRNHAF